MTYKLYKLNLNRVHFGNGSLESGGISFNAGQLFSALCIEALRYGGEPVLLQLVEAVQSNRLRISDALPYHSDTYFLPKPIIVSTPSGEQASLIDGYSDRKLLKSIKFLPASRLHSFLGRNANLGELLEQQSLIGCQSVASKAAVRTGEDARPYRVGIFSFAKDAGLYVLVRGEADIHELIERLLRNLASVGIGGKRSAGLGGFEPSVVQTPEHLKALLAVASSTKQLMTLATCLPKDEELTDDLLNGANYLLIKRSGFVSSETYTTDSPVRKQDLYTFTAGSVFAKLFEGDLFDVSAGQGSHSVWAYAKPLFIGLNATEVI